ncbi:MULTISPECIES: PAAR domain-containing protein [Pseudomonas]|nr:MULTISPECIES: PAAR domain-containing protein [Pseudomonas]AZC48369.1 PAAR domain protein [Pseudomonas chlororaphis subsp. piscium]AZC54945.1 PAAR domain protein [Pseudomonas chlororaphis subsp. piscium]AZC61266.1 PAAR domain protein [Pseudomonas chlororaphis subsp. piscium]AZC67489.1 PAAR domain protein [Pseudomonas chlororaphis subsp. piscium]AZC73678.1 PAAR domain protein [Pseudomonas chlororaphis subsp. piscium]
MLSSARLGDKHVCPLPGHGTTPIASASSDININSMGAARVGDTCGCGAVITTGFPSILLNGRPMAHLGSPTSHGGTIITGSGDTFGGFVMGPTPGAAIINFAALGAIRPDGSVDDEKMATLLADPQLEQRALLSGALVQPGSSSSTAPEEPLTPELIAIAGSQHDKSSGNQMMFIGQAVRELAEFKRSKPDLTRTLVIFTPSYSEAMLSAARGSAKGYGAGVVTVTDAQELIDYLNQGKDRKQSPIEHLSLFSHGVPHRIAFGYQLAGDFQMSLDVLSYDKISPSAFASSAQINSYACRTGMGNRSDFPVEDGIQFFPQTNESLAQLLANHLRIKVHAFVRRSDYKNTWGSFEERRMGDLCGISDNAAPGKEWCRKWGTLKDERKLSHKKHRFTYQTMGAINPVISGDTPIGVPGGHFEFLPK